MGSELNWFNSDSIEKGIDREETTHSEAEEHVGNGDRFAYKSVLGLTLHKRVRIST